MKKRGILGRLSAAVSKVTPGTETHKVAGVTYHQDALRELGTKNLEFYKTKKALQAKRLEGEPVNEYEFRTRPAELVPEPDNPHDPKAVKVIVAGRHIGYIKAGSCARIHKLLREDRIAKVTCQIGGGRRKILTRYDESEPLELEQESIPFWARLTIELKPEK